MIAHWLLAPALVMVAALRAAADPTPAAVGVAPGGGGVMPPVAAVGNAAGAALPPTATACGCRWGPAAGDRLRTRTRPGVGTTTCTYNALGQVIEEASPRGRVTRAYDAIGRKISETQHAGSTAETTLFDYDADTLRLVRMIAPGNRMTTYGYDAWGNLERTEYPGGQVITQSWDDLGRRTGISYPQGGSESWTYVGATQRVDVHTDRAQRRWKHTYTATGALESIALIGGTDQTRWTVAPSSESGAVLQRTITERVDGVERSEVEYLDAAGRVIRRTITGETAIAYGYDALSRLTERGGLGYDYDAASRITAVRDGATTRVTQSYDATTGLMATQSLTQGIERIFGHDPAGRVQSVTLAGASAGVFTAGRDDRGRLTTLTDPAGSVAFRYQDGRLASAVRTGTGAFTQLYAYDGRGNRTGLDAYTPGASKLLRFDGVAEPDLVPLTGTWVLSGDRLAASTDATAAIATPNAIPRIAWQWMGSATVTLIDAAGTRVSLKLEQDGDQARIIGHAGFGTGDRDSPWVPASTLTSIAAEIAPDGAVTITGLDWSLPTTLRDLAGIELATSAAGGSFDTIAWATYDRRTRTTTEVDQLDRPVVITEQITVGGNEQVVQTTQAFDAANNVIGRTVTIDGQSVDGSTATWDSRNRLRTWTDPRGTTTYEYRPGSTVPLTRAFRPRGGSDGVEHYVGDAQGLLSVGDVSYGTLGGSPLWSSVSGVTTALVPDMQGHIYAHGPDMSAPTIYTPHGMIVAGAVNGPGYRGMLRDPHTGFDRTLYRWHDSWSQAFMSMDPAWPGTGESAYAYCGGDPVNMWDPSGLRAIVAIDAVDQFNEWYKANSTLGTKLSYQGMPRGKEGAYFSWGRYKSRFSELGLSGDQIDPATLNQTDIGLLAAILSDKTYVYDKNGWRMANDDDQAGWFARADMATGEAVGAAAAYMGNSAAALGDELAKLDPILIPLTAPGGMPQIDIPKGAVGVVGLSVTRTLGMMRLLRTTQAVVNTDQVVARLAPALEAAPSVLGTGQMTKTKELVGFLRAEGISNPALRRQIWESGLRDAISSDSPATLDRFRRIFTRPLSEGKALTGRFGNVDTRVATLLESARLEGSGLTPFFEFRVGRRFVDIAGIDPATGEVSQLIQLVKGLRSGGINPRELDPVLDIIQETGMIPRTVVTGAVR